MRLVELEHRVELGEPDPAGGPVDLWVPVPVDDAHQSVEILERPAGAAPEGPDRHGNRWFHLRLLPAPAAAPAMVFPGPRRFTFRYRILRIPELGGAEAGGRAPVDRELYRLPAVPEEYRAELERRARRAAPEGRGEPFAVARALYDFVLEEMAPGTHQPGAGSADTARALDAHAGLAPDYAALFVDLARSRGLPARFHAGRLLPEGRPRGVLGRPHAWASFEVPGFGWIPVDPERADRSPGRAEAWFGRLPADRILFTTGRTLDLEPVQTGPPLPWLAGAYAEQDGAALRLTEILEFQDRPLR